jgi:hypothetical protein
VRLCWLHAPQPSQQELKYAQLLSSAPKAELQRSSMTVLYEAIPAGPSIYGKPTDFYNKMVSTRLSTCYVLEPILTLSQSIPPVYEQP